MLLRQLTCQKSESWKHQHIIVDRKLTTTPSVIRASYFWRYLNLRIYVLILKYRVILSLKKQTNKNVKNIKLKVEILII